MDLDAVRPESRVAVVDNSTLVEATTLFKSINVWPFSTSNSKLFISFQHLYFNPLRRALTKTTSLTFPFKKAQNVTFTDRSLHVSHNRTSSSTTTTICIQKFNSHLRYITSVSGSSQDTVDFGQFDRLILKFVYVVGSKQ